MSGSNSNVHVQVVLKLEVTEMKMCRWAYGHTLRYLVNNDDTRERMKVENITEKCRKARLRWFDHVKRRYQEYVGRRLCRWYYLVEEKEDDRNLDGCTVSTET